MLVDGAVDVIRVTDIQHEDFVKLTLFFCLQRVLLKHRNTHKYSRVHSKTRSYCGKRPPSTSPSVSRTHKVREESLGHQVEVVDSVDGDGEQARVVWGLLSRNTRTHDQQQEHG